MDFLGLQQKDFDEEDSESGITLSMKPTHNPKIYKEFENKTLYSLERISMQPFVVRDSFNIFNWNLKENYKTILGYKCQEVSLRHRGRDYVAYFTTEIPYKVGPWKFEGLPGVILEIKSTDGVFEIMANSIRMENKKIDLKRVKLADVAISWDEYLEKYNKKYNELKSYTDENGGSHSIPKKNIEVYIED